MKELIAKSLNWDELGNHEKSEYEFAIGKSEINKESKVLTVNISLNFVIPYLDVVKIKRSILENVEQLNDVKLIFNYKDVILTPAEIVKHFVPHMINMLNEDISAFKNSIQFNNIELTEEKVTIYSLGKVATNTLNEKAAPKLSELIKEHFGMDVNFVFENNETDYRKILDRIEKNDDEEKAAIVSKNSSETQANTQTKSPASNYKKSSWKERNNQSKMKERPAEGKRLYGSLIKEEPVEFADVNPNKGILTVSGEVFKIESRLLKKGNYLVTFIITNGKSSLQCKAFMGEEKLNELQELLPTETPVLMKGNPQINKYDNQLEIMLSDINLGDKKEGKIEKYQGESKRVELHCHSKMSQLDGLNDPQKIVDLAYKWGQKAVAITDHGVVQAFPDMDAAAKKYDGKIKIIFGMEGYIFDDEGLVSSDGTIDYKARHTNHIIILARNQEGIKDLYKLVSDSHLKYFYRRPRIPWSLLDANRKNLIIGSACEAGELYRAILYNEPEEKIEKIANRYDYLEIEPLTNNKFMIENGTVNTNEDLKEINKKIVALGKKLGKLVCATTDAHYENEDSAIYRNIIMAGQGYKDVETGTQGLYLRTTQEMLDEFSYLGEDVAKEVVIDNTNKIADMVDANVHPVPEGKFPPKIQNSDETLRNSCYEKAHSIYGNPLPMEIEERLEKELDSIIGNGYAVMYVSAQMLVNKSMSDGYLVGSRGSVGSSFAATMAGITEVNPLPAHYVCPKCKHLEWGDPSVYSCGCDMPEKECPECGEKMNQDGYTIPFETFLGFSGDKEPDIDLNFAGEYQATAHKYVGKIFGEKNVYKAGTVGTIATLTAKGFVRKYFEEINRPVDDFEVERLAYGCEGVRRTTGQHPGGIVILPENHEITEFTPVQHPANDVRSDIITTHFDYHKIDKNLLKLDILGHDGPSMMRHLQDMTNVSPFEIPYKDEKVMSIFTSTEALDIKDPENYLFKQGSLAVPEFGTNFTRQMLDDTKPSKIADLVRISGFSHGTDVWKHNAQDYIDSGQASITEVISTRDGIMNYLILKGLPKPESFQIMEKVRKGKGVSKENEELMKEHGVPNWYIESCNKIKYLFPRAHAAAYVMASWRLAWFKVYYPKEFYAAYLSTKVQDFNIDVALDDIEKIKDIVENLQIKAGNDTATQKERAALVVDEVIYEMRARGYEFEKPKLGKSESSKFSVDQDKVLIPFEAIDGVGSSAAITLVDEYNQKPYATVEDLQKRGKINKTATEVLRKYGVLEGLPETDQISLFSMLETN